MPVIRNSPRAFVIALIPLVLTHAALMANGVAGSTAGGGELPAPDRAFMVFAMRFGIDVMLLWIGHMILRPLGLPARGSYAIMGGVAVALGFALAHFAEIRLSSPTPGAVVTSAILPVIAGMLTGFLYAQLARRESRAAKAAVDPKAFRPTEHATLSSSMPVFAVYSGPIQVRTSIGATAITAAIPAFIVSMLTLGVIMPFLAGETAAAPHPGPHSAYAALLALPAQVMFVTLVTMFVPSVFVVGATHGLARSLGRTRAIEYAGIGAAVGALGSLLLAALVPVPLLIVLGTLIGAVMGLIYRRFAGIEPLPLPEDVLADDPAALVGADHPSRREHAIIFNG
jgi:hypothetical protein